MSNLIIIFGLVIFVKLSMNFFRYRACNKYYKIYKANLINPQIEFLENQPQIIKLFKEAGIEDNVVAHVEHVGYNQILANANISVMANMGNVREDVVGSVMRMFHQAKGIYRSRMLDAINPFYWLEFVIFLPRNIFQYVGASPESALVKLVQIIYWFLASIVGFLFGVFGDEIKVYIKDVLLPALGIK